MSRHSELLDRYAELIVKAGVNIRVGQQLLISAPLEAVDLVRRITFHAYRAGASLVTTLYNDEQTSLMRYTEGHAGSFDAAPSWLFGGMAEAKLYYDADGVGGSAQVLFATLEVRSLITAADITLV